MTPFWNGTVYSAEFMAEVEDHIFFTKQTQTEVSTKPKNRPKKHLLKGSIQTERHASFTMHTTITFAL